MPREGNLAYQVAKRHQATGAHDVSTVPLQGQFSSVITFRVRRVRGEMHIGHGRLSVCLSVPRRIPTLLHGSRCNFGENGRECPLVVHYWADLQSVHGFRCYDNIAPNAKCQRVLVLVLCLVLLAVFLEVGVRIDQVDHSTVTRFHH